MNATQARQIPAQNLLANFGIRPVKETAREAWYRSPLRQREQTPSFKVCKQRNSWFDHGTGQGGNSLDLTCLLLGSKDVKQALRYLREHANQIPEATPQPAAAEAPAAQPGVELLAIQPLKNPQLIDYLKRRAIPLDLARVWLSEARYRAGGYEWSGLAFANDQGGYELRSRAFKGCTAPKAPTWIHTGSSRLILFEGFFDFLSWLVLREITRPDHDVLVLNSLAFARREGQRADGYGRIDAYLDNDPAGREALQYFPQATDYGGMLAPRKDLNEWLAASRQGRW
jgi:hypothetical protein